MTFIENDCAAELPASLAVVSVRTWGQLALAPAEKSSEQALMAVPASGAGKQSFWASPLMLRASNPMSPLENWIYTARSKVTAATVVPFSPMERGWGLPKKLLPLAVVLKTR